MKIGRIVNAFPRYWRRLARNRRNRSQASVDAGKGPLAGNTHFWKVSPKRSWKEIESRLFTLAKLNREDVIEDFLCQALRLGGNAPSLLFLARSGLSRPILARVLRGIDHGAESELAERIRKSPQFSGSLAAAALSLLTPREAAPLMKRIAAIHPSLPEAYHVLLDSHAFVPSAAASYLRGTVPASPTRKAARHRLIIADSLKDPVRLSLLFADAEEVTVFSPNDLYGHAHFPDDIQLHARPRTINVVHPRSRITRFSARYQALHEETWRIAEEMISELERQSDGILAEAAPHAALYLADALFFQALRRAAFQDFVQEEGFDQIVIAATGHSPHKMFFCNLTGGIRLDRDPRIEFTCLASTMTKRVAFTKAVSHAFTPTRSQAAESVANVLVRPLGEILVGIAKGMSPQVRKMETFEAESKPHQGAPLPRQKRILYVTSQVGTYNSSSQSYLEILSRHYNTLACFVGARSNSFFATLLSEYPNLQRLGAASSRPYPGLADTLRNFVSHSCETLLREGRAPLTAHVLLHRSEEIAVGTLQTAYLHWLTMDRWFDNLRKRGQLPELVVLSPMRPALVGMAAAAARRFGVPSLSLEPHGLNATYCRYCLVSTDRYGVITSFFREEAAHGFAIPADRIDIIGSPRLKAPHDYDAAASTLAARAAIGMNNPVAFSGQETVITFFSQPSSWRQMSEVWTIILQALRELPGARLLLKLHPEEGVARIIDYMAIAEELGMAARVDHITATAIEAIEASDLILACYSTTVIEATIYRKPAFCVINGDNEYPLEQHKVVGAPLLRDAASLRAEIAAFQADPTPFHERVARFLEREPQVLSGPEQPLVDAINAILERPASENIRPDTERPHQLFIKGPHRVFDT